MLGNKYLINKQDSFHEQYLRMYPGKKMPREVTFIVTESCNLCCSYCYQHDKTSRVMPFEVAKKCVDTLYNADLTDSKYINPTDAPAVVLSFIGGEPFFEIELIDRIVDCFLKRAIELNHRWQTQYMISMSSNGTLYFDERVQRFIRKHEGRVSIGITIDGNKALHNSCRKYPDGRGSYDEAAAAFSDILKKYNQRGTKLTIAPGNLPYLAQAVKDMRHDFGIDTLYGNVVYEDVWNEDLAKEYYIQLKLIADWMIDSREYENFRFSRFDDRWYRPQSPEDNQNWCGGAGMMLAFGVDGIIYPCQRYAPHSLGPDVKPIIVGHIDHGIEATDEEKETSEMLRKVTRRSQSTDECFNCPVATGCGWCSAYNYEKFGTVDKRATFICPMHRTEALANVYYWNRLARKLRSNERLPMRLPKEIAERIVGEEEYEMLVGLSESEAIRNVET